MLAMYTTARNFLHEESGQDLIEYALLGALVAVAAAVFIPALTTAIHTTFTNIATAIG